MTPMTLEKFDQLTRRDFENGAVLDEIRAALSELITVKATLAGIVASAPTMEELEHDRLRDALKQLASYFEQQMYAYRKHGDNAHRPTLARVFLAMADTYEHAVIMVRAYQETK